MSKSSPLNSCCFSCCTSCSSKPPPITPLGPFELSNLLQIGTFRFQLSPTRPNRHAEVCGHSHVSDGWHFLQRPDLLLGDAQNPQDADVLRNMAFLLRNQFLVCTYAFTAPQRDFMHLRVYMVPWDLSGIEGKLLQRQNTVVKSGYQYLSSLLVKVSDDPCLWHGLPYLYDYIHYVGIPDSDIRTMAEIYGSLPSPKPLNPLDPSLLDGMKSQLYPYQLESVGAMLDIERLRPKEAPDPLFIPVKGMGDQTFYLKPSTNELLRECPLYSSTRGGVLCEELGTGKTIIILSLIQASIGELSSPEELVEDTPPIVMTPLSSRHFPFPDEASARRRATSGAHEVEEPVGCPSLLELALHQSRINPRRARVAIKFNARLSAYAASQTPFYHTYAPGSSDIQTDERVRPKRGQRKDAPPHRVMYLTTASLIVVPNSLVAQWTREIQKHFHVGFAPRVLVVTRLTSLPLAQRIASDYDIILMSATRFTKEASKNSTIGLYTKNLCTCPSFPATRFPDCTCPGHPDASILLQIRWSRLVVDEGHNTGNSVTTNVAQFARLLSVESRWIVTGTPAANLLGLSFGSASATEKGTGTGTGKKRKSLSSESEEENEGESRTRIWTEADRADLGKLSIMVTHFLDVSRFSCDPERKMFGTHVVAPLLRKQGPALGAIEVLTQTMQLVMIRHRIEDVEKDVELLPLTQETVLLDLEPHGIKSYNALQASIAVSAVDSERVDQDYMFHPKNTRFLRMTIDNMSQILFFSVDTNLYNIDDMLFSQKGRLEKAQKRLEAAVDPERKRTKEFDLQLLEEAHAHIKAAASDELWRSLQESEEMPYIMENIPEEIYNAWSRTPVPVSPPFEEEEEDTPSNLLHADFLCILRELATSRPLISEDELILQGQENMTRDQLVQERLEAGRSGPNKNKGKSAVVQGPRNAAPVENKAHTSKITKKAPASAKKVEVERELRRVAEEQRVLESLEDSDEEGDSLPMVSTVHPNSSTGSVLLRSSLLAATQVGKSTSSKLNFILSEVLAYSTEEKFLIFSESPLTLAHVGEGLDVIGVPFLKFTSTESSDDREGFAMAFEASPRYRVLLMVLQHGARGLNLVAASRILFCEPVWQADVESQAIKRAHRIGQTRPITVKTLAIRNTHEEEMMKRRETLKQQGGAVKVHMTDEKGMRNFIENPQFLSSTPDPTRLPSFTVPLLKLPPPNPDSMDMDMDVDDSTEPVPSSSTPRIRFAAEPAQPSSTLPKRKISLRFAAEESRAASSSTSTPMDEDREVEDSQASFTLKKRKVSIRFAE